MKDCAKENGLFEDLCADVRVKKELQISGTRGFTPRIRLHSLSFTLPLVVGVRLTFCHPIVAACPMKAQEAVRPPTLPCFPKKHGVSDTALERANATNLELDERKNDLHTALPFRHVESL